MIFMSWGAHPPQMCTLHRHWNRNTWCKNIPNLHQIFPKWSDNTVPWCTMHYRYSSSLAWAVADFCNYGWTSHTMAVYKNPWLWEIIFLCLSSAIWAPCHNQSPSPSTRKAPLPRTKKLVGLHEEAASDFQLKIHCNRRTLRNASICDWSPIGSHVSPMTNWIWFLLGVRVTRKRL